MTSIKEAFRHYQRRIDRFVENETILLHCLEKLNKLPVVVKYLQETRVGSTVNNLRKHDGKVGLAAAALVAKWKKEVDSKSSGEHERRHTNDTKNVEPSAVLNKVTDSQETNGTPNSNSVNYPSDSKSSRSEKSQEESSQLERKSGKKCDETRSCTSSSSVSNSKDIRENGSTQSSHRRDKRKHSKQGECEETNGKKRKCGPDLIDIDYTMGTSFAEALGMLDMPSTSKARKLLTNKTSPSNTSTSRLGKRSSFDETPILLKNRPRLDPPQDIAAELLLPNTSSATEVITREYVSRQPRKQTILMTDEETISHSITSRTVKTKVFSGNKADKSKVTTLFEMCIRILQDNIDLLEFIGGVPFDILRPVLERTTCEQLMALEDYNPYLMEDTHCLWEQHCKRRFRSKSREELETWRDMYIRCLDEEQTKFNILTASIKLSKERQTKPAFVDTNAPVKPKGMKSSALRVAGPVGDSKLQNVTKLKDSTQKPKRTKQLNDDPDWTPTTWYKTLYKKPKVPKPVKPPKPPIKKTIDMLRYDRARALEHKKEEWKKRPR